MPSNKYLAWGENGLVYTEADVSPAIQSAINSGGGGSTNIKETEVDFGTGSYITEKTFNVTDADVTTNSALIASLAIKSPSDNRDIDEALSEQLLFYCKPLAGSFDLIVKSLCGSVNGKFLVNYLVG